MYEFNTEEIKQIEARGARLDLIYEQLRQFRNGVAFARLVRPATVGDGILALSPEDKEQFISHYEKTKEHLSIVKFVPASGAATRMFKDLFKFIEDGEHCSAVELFISKLTEFPFYEDLRTIMSKKQLDMDDRRSMCGLLLHEHGLNYGQLPKGLLKFHTYQNEERTPFKEQLVESIEYASSGNSEVKVHFTVSKEHIAKFEEHFEYTRSTSPFADIEFNLDFSTQDPSTDTIAVDMSNEPFKQDGSAFLFRPGGHGALIKNLNTIDADLIFIKNIDNVVHDDHKEDTFIYKKAIGGVLTTLQQNIFGFLNRLDHSHEPSLFSEIEEFFRDRLFIELPNAYFELDISKKPVYLHNMLNRPLRVCGMVKNTGEPGGGPFWVRDKDGSASLQIVEAAQVDEQNAEQKNILQSSTHFNPVDLVCGIRDYKGQKFDLTQYVDPNSGFITHKTSGGKDIKALEYPGLWNGAMAHWNTLFVEVPITTFNPVKTVNDLLKPLHKSSKPVIKI